MRVLLYYIILILLIIKPIVICEDYIWVTQKWRQTVFAQNHVSVTFFPIARNITWNVVGNKPFTLYLMSFDDYNKLKFRRPFHFFLSVYNTTNTTGRWDNKIDIANGIALGIKNEGTENLETVSTVSQYIPTRMSGVEIAIIVFVCFCALSLILISIFCTFSGNLALFD